MCWRSAWDWLLPSTEYALRAEEIGKFFGRVQVLKAASLWGEPGKVTTLLGRNGVGKSTLMKSAAGVLRADYGVVSVFGDARKKHSLAPMFGSDGVDEAI